MTKISVPQKVPLGPAVPSPLATPLHLTANILVDWAWPRELTDWTSSTHECEGGEELRWGNGWNEMDAWKRNFCGCEVS